MSVGTGEILAQGAIAATMWHRAGQSGRPARHRVRAAPGAGTPAAAPARLPDGWDDAGAMAATLATLTNDLEAPAIRLLPSIRDVLRAIAETPGCLLARMSGSGATCFGLFSDPITAEAAAAVLRRPGWWSWGGGLAR